MAYVNKQYNKLFEAFGNKSKFSIDEVKELFNDYNTNTVYWLISSLLHENKIVKLERGIYTFNKKTSIPKVSLSDNAKKIKEILAGTGFRYYISGLDIILNYVQHIPQHFPVILYVEKGIEDDVSSELAHNGLSGIFSKDAKKIFNEKSFNALRLDFIIYRTVYFKYANDEIATYEKAFLDLYYAITRNDYPMDLYELSYIFNNAVRRGAIGLNKLQLVSRIKNMQNDFKVITGIVDATDSAIRLAMNIRETI